MLPTRRGLSSHDGVRALKALDLCCRWSPMRSTIIRCLLVVTLAQSALWAVAAEPAVEVGGVSFDARIQLAGQALPLNGAGVFAPLRAFPWVKGYAAALYLGQRAATAGQVLAQGGPKRLQMRMLLDVPVAEFVKAFHKGVDRNTPTEQHARLTERMARFDGLLEPLGTVHKGDRVDLDFVPGQGLLFVHNGKLLGPAIPGDDLYGALLLVFIGERPVNDKLKASLLGKSA